MKIRWSIAVLAALFCLSTPSLFGKTINTLNINRKDGKTDQLALHADMQMRPGVDNNILLIHPQLTAEYSLDEVINFSYGYRNFSPGVYYSGDHQQGSISAPTAAGVTISLQPEYVTVSGAASISLHALNGVELQKVKAAGAETVIDLSALPAGVYILTADSSTFKLKK